MANGIRAFSNPKYDYYELTEDLAGLVPKGTIFVHDTDDSVRGSVAQGCLVSCWTPDGNCYKGGCHTGCIQEDSAVYPLFVSAYTRRSQGKGVYNDEYYCQFSRTWLGRNSGRVKSHGGTGKAGGR